MRKGYHIDAFEISSTILVMSQNTDAITGTWQRSHVVHLKETTTISAGAWNLTGASVSPKPFVTLTTI